MTVRTRGDSSLHRGVRARQGTLAARPAANGFQGIWRVSSGASAGAVFVDVAGVWHQLAGADELSPSVKYYDADDDGVTRQLYVLGTGASDPAGLQQGDLVIDVRGSDPGIETTTLAGYREVLDDRGNVSGNVTLDFAAFNVWRINPTGAVNILFTNLPGGGYVIPGTLIIANDAHAITWPAGTKFNGAAPPEPSGETWLSLVASSTHVTVGPAWTDVGVAA